MTRVPSAPIHSESQQAYLPLEHGSHLLHRGQGRDQGQDRAEWFAQNWNLRSGLDSRPYRSLCNCNTRLQTKQIRIAFS